MDKDLLNTLHGIPLAELAKAIKELHGLDGTQHLHELWQDLHGIPKSEEVPGGPSMHSSGGGAVKAVEAYSNPAPQVGIAKEYDNFMALINDFSAAMKAEFAGLKEAVVANTAAITSVKSEVAKKEEASVLTKAWNDLTELEKAVIKAEEHSEKEDVKELDEAKEAIEKAEKHLDSVKEHEKEEESMKAISAAYLQMQRGWTELSKASVLARYGLRGHGNQADRAIPDSSHTKSPGGVEGVKKADTTAVVAKADDEKEEHEEHEEKKCSDVEIEKAIATLTQYAAAKKSEGEAALVQAATATPAAAPAAAVVASPEAIVEKASSEASLMSEIKRLSNELASVKSTMSDVTRTPAVVPIIMKSGAASATLVDKLNKAVTDATSTGELSEENSNITCMIINHMQAAANGHLSETMVKAEVTSAPIEVRNFLDSFSVSN